MQYTQGDLLILTSKLLKLLNDFQNQQKQNTLSDLVILKVTAVVFVERFSKSSKAIHSRRFVIL